MPHPNDPKSPEALHRTSTWTPDLSVGVDEIDAQHRELLDRIDRVFRSLEGRHAEGEIRRLLGFLETYVVLHFGTEEKLMVRSGYPDTKAHQREHEHFLTEFATIKQQFGASGATPATVQAVSSRLCDWLTTHIRTVDRKLGHFLASRMGAGAHAPIDSPRSPLRGHPPMPEPDRAPDPPSALIWTEDLAVGVELIDQQHQELFRRVNKLLGAARKGLARHEVSNMLDFLGQYVIEHFEAEEAVMRASSYPDLRVHKAQHDAFRRELQKYTEGLASSGATVSLVVELNRTVCSWLTSHVRRSDKALGQYLTRRAGDRVGS